MLKLIAIGLAVTGVLTAHNVDDEWSLIVGIALVGFGLGLADEHGERRKR